MERLQKEEAKEILNGFEVGNIISCEPYGNGHINDTFLAVCDTGRYIFQSLNTTVFKKSEKVMENIEKVTGFLKGQGLDERHTMTLVPAKDGKSYIKDSLGRCFRVYKFIENSICLEHPESAKDFYECAVAFGSFQHYLNNFSVDELFETIPDFHNTPKRFKDFIAAVDADVCGRADGVREEIDFIKQREDFYGILFDANKNGNLPLRVTHNDTKSNNVMLDKDDRSALCVIDLDTIMAGFSVNDFGDSIRFGANTACEDEKDLSKVSIDLELFEAYVKGYIEGSGGILTNEEIMLLPEGAKMMTVECGMRFLTDYLSGDTYFKTAYPEHNLVRCRTHLKLVADMEKHWEEMKNIVKKYNGR